MNNDSYKISIIVPVYGVEKYLDRCVESIISQSYTNWEIIMVDDGSPDACPQMCDAWALRDSRIRVIHKENGGLSSARNAGLDAASGELICFVDSDDAIASTLCEAVIVAFAANNVEAVVFDCQQITERGEILGSTETLTTGVLTKEEALEQLVSGRISNFVCNKVYKYDLLGNIRFTEHLRCFEDIDITYRLILKTDHIYCLDEQLYLYYRRSDSLSGSMTALKLCDLYQVRLERYRVLKELYPHLAELAFTRLALAAFRLFDRSLWEIADAATLADAKNFLKINRDKVLAVNKSIEIRLYYFLPKVYNAMRRVKHVIGNALKYIKNKTK